MGHYSKAIAAVLGTFIGGVGTAMADGNITQAELIVAVGAALVGAGAVLVAPANTPA